jgi:heparinase II/III-like protein
MNPARLLKMRPAEIATRAQQAYLKRWGRPPDCRLIPSAAASVFPDLPPLASLAAAEKIRRHRFDLLGYEDLDFGTPIDWHLDPVHHKRSPRIPWRQIPFLDFDRIGDHKIIWELNRHQHLVTLAQAGFRDEILAQWTHWQSENPYPIGINWASTLEVAFRALSWLWVRHFIGDFHPDLIPALHLHGWYIEHFLSTYFSPNTHLLGEGVALFAIGTMCPQIADAPRWQTRGWQIVRKQAETQVRPDGFHFEQSIYYHVYALDFFQFARTLAAKNALAIPPSFDRTIEKMSDALAILSQAGRLPSFGDDDGGRVIGSPARPLAPSPHQPVGGIYSMTDAHSQLFIDAGPQGALTGGHSHADALSIQLITSGHPVLIDPGTFCYVCPERDRFRGTAAHNTLQVDGRDQAQPNGPFAWTGTPETTVDRWHTGETFDFFAGHHNGYAPVIHHRSVFGLKNKFWLVRDVAHALARAASPLVATHGLAIHWHFLDERDISILPPAGHNWSQFVERWDWSPVYGKKEPAYALRFSAETSLPAEFAVLLVPGEAGIFTQTAPGAYCYKEPQGSHEFIFTNNHFLYRATTPDGVTEHSI